MKKRYFLLVGLLPLFYACGNKVTNAPIKYQDYSVINEEEEESDACTVMYVGKDVSTNGKAIIARSSDAGPGAMMINTTIFEHNELANQTVTSNKGFSYKMPSTTYRYISTPRNSVIHKGHHWEASAINENGVGVSATLSCTGNSDVNRVDPLIPTGISEDNIAQIVGATATTAREGIEIIANIIEEKGACDGNAIMTIDQNEAWYMEIYGGHLYAAVKLPNDKVLTAGNEFVLDSINEMNISHEDTLLSKSYDLFDKSAGFRVPSTCENVWNMNLSDTFGKRLSETTSVKFDYNHMRTWRGINLFAKERPEYESYKQYGTESEYPALFNINDGDELSIHDVTKFMRDRYENILDPDEEDPNYEYFLEADKEHQLRYIGIETAYQIHMIQVDKDLPKDLAATEWLSISNANYTPFVPINCSINHMSDYYTHVSSTYEYDEQSAANIFKKLNTLARNDRTYYGKQVEEFWTNYEHIWEDEYYQLIDQVKKLDTNSRYDILTNYITRTQDNAVKTALFMIDDLTWHMMNDSFQFGDATIFRPCVNVKDYALKHRYSYEKNGKTVKFAKGDDKYSLTLINEEYRPGPDTSQDYRTLGEISYGETKEEIDMVIDGEEVYVPYADMINYIKGNIVINADDYRTIETPFNHAVWIVPTAIGLPIIGASIIGFINTKKRKPIKKK